MPVKEIGPPRRAFNIGGHLLVTRPGDPVGEIDPHQSAVRMPVFPKSVLPEGEPERAGTLPAPSRGPL